MDRDAAHDGRNARDTRDVLPRLSDRSDAVPTRVNRISDAVDSAQFSPSFQFPAHPSQTSQPLQPQQAKLPQELPVHSSAPSSFQNSSRHYFQHNQPAQQPPHAHFTHAATNADSQDTTSSTDTTASTDTDQVFTPPISEGGLSIGGGGSGSANGSSNAQGYEHDYSSQESQLLQLSRLAAASERMADIAGPDAFDGGAQSRKRAADGTVKHVRNASSTSPVFTGGHSRNTSTVSVASTAGSRIGELSAELKTRLSYAMVKVNNGWQSHSIDQVESLASQAASPASSTSTIHGRHGASASPRIRGTFSHHRQLSQASQASVSTASTTIAATGRTLPSLDTSWSSQQSTHSNHSTPPLPSPLAPSRTGSTAPTRSLAPPAPIQPSRPSTLSRRNSNPIYASASYSSSYSQHTSPHTPGNLGASSQRTPGTDSIHFSPHQNVREQDAIETLLFMSSPGNSASMKHFPSISSSQPLPSGHHDPHQHHHQASANVGAVQRHALPSAPRKSLPTSRPGSQAYGAQSQPARHGAPDRTPGHHRSPSDMDVDEPYGTPYSRTTKGTPKRRANGTYRGADVPTPRLKVPLSMPSGLSVASKPRPMLDEEDIEKMLDRAAAASADDSSDSDSEILIPVRRTGGPVGI